MKSNNLAALSVAGILLLMIVAGAYYYGVYRGSSTGGNNIDNSVADVDDRSTSTVGDTIQSISYRNEEYGFYFSLPAGWSGYSVVTSQWQGFPDGQSDNSARLEIGPKVVLSDTRVATSSGDSWQDIPIMIFTIEQWNQDLIVSPAPVGPTELGRNNRYVFALPPRAVGWVATLGVREVSDWLQSKPVHTFNK